MEDQKRLPYVEAFLAEIQRHATIAPFSVQHTPLQDVVFQGYKLPKNTIITLNLAEVMKDPQNFDEPHEFKPERFINAKGEFSINTKAWLPFGSGKRECLGKSLAKEELFLFTSALVHQFEFQVSEKMPDLNNCHVAIARSPAKCKVKFVPRDN